MKRYALSCVSVCFLLFINACSWHTRAGDSLADQPLYVADDSPGNIHVTGHSTVYSLDDRVIKEEEGHLNDSGEFDGIAVNDGNKHLNKGEGGAVVKDKDSSNTFTVVESSLTNERTHTVNEGDNLYRIGMQYGMNWKQIARENNIQNPSHLSVGRVLRIPATQLKTSP